MEAHHPHHVTHKKKWPEYLLEFFMLFLAVFLGFVAENIRKQSVEKHREKQFIQSFVEDLKIDSAAIQMVKMNGISRPTNNPPLRSYEEDFQQDLAYYIQQIRGSAFLIETRLQLLDNKAKNTMAFLQKEYQMNYLAAKLTRYQNSLSCCL